MPVIELSAGESVSARRREPVVCIPAYCRPGDLERCLSSVLEHTSTEIPVVVAGVAGGEDAVEVCASAAARTSTERRILYRRPGAAGGLVHVVNDLLDATSPGDVVLVGCDCVVAEGWLERLQEAVYGLETTATASPFSAGGEIVSFRRWTGRDEQRGSLEHDAAAVDDASLRLRPHVPTMLGGCAYVRRTAIDLVGRLDPTFDTYADALIDWSQRCVRQGLSHVVADDVLVAGARLDPNGSAGDGTTSRRHDDELLDRRHPYYEASVALARWTVGPLTRSIAIARRATTGGFSVTVDGRDLGQHVTGTQVHTLELIRGLARSDALTLRVLVPSDLGAHAGDVLDELAVDRVPVDARPTLDTMTDVVHRPYQVFRGDDLDRLARLGRRIVITQQDFIAYRNPSYFQTVEEWREHRELTEVALAVADRVLFFSEYIRRCALEDELVDPEATDVIHLGADHRGFERDDTDAGAVPALRDTRFLLCLGTDYRHKNRVFALRLLEALKLRHGWDGSLVLAGAFVGGGSSRKEEAAFLDGAPGIADAVLDLGSVTEAQKCWLLEHARAVVYPTLHEGFGLIPFEAAALGTPCVYAWQTSLAETLPRDAATIVPWDPAATADRVAPLLADDTARRAVVEAIRSAAARFTWEATVSKVVEAYEKTLRSPVQPGRNALFSRQATVGRPPSGAAPTLRGVEDAIPEDARSFLAAVAFRPWLRAPVFGSFSLAFRAGHLVRHARSRIGPRQKR